MRLEVLDRNVRKTSGENIVVIGEDKQDNLTDSVEMDEEGEVDVENEAVLRAVLIQAKQYSKRKVIPCIVPW